MPRGVFTVAALALLVAACEDVPAEHLQDVSGSMMHCISPEPIVTNEADSEFLWRAYHHYAFCGEGSSQDIEALRILVARDDPRALYTLSVLTLNTHRDASEAEILMRRAAERGYAPAIAELERTRDQAVQRSTQPG